MSTLEKIEKAVVEGFEKLNNGHIEAKERIAKEQPQVKKYDHEAAMAAQKERIEKSIEASKNA